MDKFVCKICRYQSTSTIVSKHEIYRLKGSKLTFILWFSGNSNLKIGLIIDLLLHEDLIVMSHFDFRGGISKLDYLYNTFKCIVVYQSKTLVNT